jgi:predicted phage tail protein
MTVAFWKSKSLPRFSKSAVVGYFKVAHYPTYPLLAAKRDLVAYINAGTLASGLQELHEETGAATAATATSAAKAPVAPSSQTAVGGNSQVSLVWGLSSGATSYNLYWATSRGVTTTNGTKISGMTNSYTHSGLTNGTTYYYVVTAVNASGESAASAQASATPAAVIGGVGTVLQRPAV